MEGQREGGGRRGGAEEEGRGEREGRGKEGKRREVQKRKWSKIIIPTFFFSCNSKCNTQYTLLKT